MVRCTTTVATVVGGSVGVGGRLVELVVLTELVVAPALFADVWAMNAIDR